MIAHAWTVASFAACSQTVLSLAYRSISDSDSANSLAQPCIAKIIFSFCCVDMLLGFTSEDTNRKIQTSIVVFRLCVGHVCFCDLPLPRKLVFRKNVFCSLEVHACFIQVLVPLSKPVQERCFVLVSGEERFTCVCICPRNGNNVGVGVSQRRGADRNTRVARYYLSGYHPKSSMIPSFWESL